ncbi:unnamed protein product [Rhizoctonia solani]|uniref:Uncharacterized protein n=1 Tax=Rhizoctonia solani TaxID=456999 RepID=A0A8H3BAN7_9AGAM|nr:unnamed protein product [Rhizoctonia solani]
MDNPTHADAFLNLLSSCFPSSCRPSPPALPPSPRLGALLRDSESDDAMSLHSTYRPHTRQKKKKPTMQLCGLNLFGKPRGQIRLEDDDETEPPLPRPRPRYDSDAAPVPDSTIQSLSARSPTSEQPTRQESPEEELARLRAEKAARKARKRERKLKRQLALEQTGEFEGFIGSGDGRDGFPISPPSTTTSTPGIEDLMSDRGSSKLVHDADPEDGEADMGAAVYTRSTRSRSESGSSATRSSRAREEGLVPGNALGLRGPPSPLAQSHIPEANEAEPIPPRSELQTQPEPMTKSKPEPEPMTQAHQPEPITESKPRPKPKIHISDLPLSSPGAGPGPRTLENSPRLNARREVDSGSETPRREDGYGFPSHLPSPRLGLPPPRLPSGFPSPGLSRKGFPSPGLGKSHGSGTGLGLNSTSGSGALPVENGSGKSVVGSTSKSVLPGGNGSESSLTRHVLDEGRDAGSGDAGSQRSRGSGDGSGSVGSGQGGGGNANWGEGRGGRITAGMGVALANRG